MYVIIPQETSEASSNNNVKSTQHQEIFTKHTGRVIAVIQRQLLRQPYHAGALTNTGRRCYWKVSHVEDMFWYQIKGKERTVGTKIWVTYVLNLICFTNSAQMQERIYPLTIGRYTTSFLAILLDGHVHRQLWCTGSRSTVRKSVTKISFLCSAIAFYDIFIISQIIKTNFSQCRNVLELRVSFKAVP
jgi:hypothetical protein